jgi:hypothetical protein
MNVVSSVSFPEDGDRASLRNVALDSTLTRLIARENFITFYAMFLFATRQVVHLAVLTSGDKQVPETHVRWRLRTFGRKRDKDAGQLTKLRENLQITRELAKSALFTKHY